MNIWITEVQDKWLSTVFDEVLRDLYHALDLSRILYATKLNLYKKKLARPKHAWATAVPE